VVENGVIRGARLGLGGVATVPWRLRTAENILRGAHPDVEIFRTAAEVALAEATPLRENAFKIELAKRTIVRALFTMLEAES
jgi:xanthine dehydrogenase YagS FAD-binding subunit